MVKISISLVLLMLCTCQAMALEPALSQPHTAPNHASHKHTVSCQFALPDTISALARCTTIRFPVYYSEDYTEGSTESYTEADNSPALTLHSVTIPGTTNSNTATMLLDGGPGGSGNAVLQLLADPEFAQRLLALGDVVVLAQRGTRFSSQPLNCSGSHEACIRKLEKTEHIDSFTTENSARDIIRFVDDANYSGIRIVAYSYGTRLALQVIQQSPEKLLAIALDSVIPLKTNHQDLRGIDDALIALDRECSASDDCIAHVSNSVVDSFLSSLANLEDNPIIVPSALGSIKLTPQVFLERVVNGIQSGHTLKYIPRFISEISRSKPGLISRDLLNGPGIGISQGNSDLAVGLLMAVNCSDIDNVYDHRIDQTIDNLQRHISTEASLAGIEILKQLLTKSVDKQGVRCRLLPGSEEPVLAAAIDAASAIDAPSLLLSGALDPIAPEDNATFVQRQLGDNSRSVLLPGISHAVTFESHCSRSLITSFFEDSNAELELDCVADSKIDFPAGNGFVVQ